MRNTGNVTITGHNNILLKVLPVHTNSSFIRVSPLLLKWVRSSIFVHDVVQTAECFPDQLLIFTRRRHHIITTLRTDFPLILITLLHLWKLKNLFQMHETAYFLHSLVSRHTSQPEYYRILSCLRISMIVRKYKIELLLSAINARECQWHFISLSQSIQKEKFTR